MTERRYTVVGMTCDHCALSVREEVSELEGVDDVDVELISGRLRVRGEDVSDAAVSDAVAAAGYAVVGIVSLLPLTGAFNLVAGLDPSTTARSAA